MSSYPEGAAELYVTGREHARREAEDSFNRTMRVLESALALTPDGRDPSAPWMQTLDAITAQRENLRVARALVYSLAGHIANGDQSNLPEDLLREVDRFLAETDPAAARPQPEGKP